MLFVEFSLCNSGVRERNRGIPVHIKFFFSLPLAPPRLLYFVSMGDDNKDEERVYGGCEGPDAMYVKLISSDGHEFIVKRDHALTSGTIKAMLSGPGQFSENETNEVNFREIP